MYLNTEALAKALRGYGLKVVVPKGHTEIGRGPMEKVQTLTFHHTAGPRTGLNPTLGTVIHGRPDLNGPLCNAYVDREGTWYLISDGRANHAGAVLKSSYESVRNFGVEVEATGQEHDEFSPGLYDSCVRGFAALAGYFGLGADRVLGHKEICSPRGRKIDPRPINMDLFRSRVAATGRTAPQGDPKIRAVQTAIGMPRDARDGDLGPKTQAALLAARRKARTNRTANAMLIRNVQRAIGLKPLLIPGWGGRTDAALKKLGFKI